MFSKVVIKWNKKNERRRGKSGKETKRKLHSRSQKFDSFGQRLGSTLTKRIEARRNDRYCAARNVYFIVVGY